MKKLSEEVKKLTVMQKIFGKHYLGAVLTVLFLMWFFADKCSAQTKPEIKPSVRLEQSELVAIVSQLDTLSVTVIRSDMAKQERNSSADRLNAIRNFLIAKFDEQNKAKQDSIIKAKK